MKRLEKMKKIAAWCGIVLLAGLYLATVILGLLGSESTKSLLMACIVCTVVVPVLLYAMILMAKVLGGKDAPADQPQKNERDQTP